MGIGQVQKHGASSPVAARALIVGQDDNNVIEMIFPPQRFM
jgi:hypothetical protein